jgi:TetR/AcrR family transcriptional regulator
MGRQKRNMEQPDANIRRTVLRSAAELFNRKGYAATTVREIVEKAGVSKPVLYYYFGNKEGIFLEIVRTAYDSLIATIEVSQEDSRSVEERITELFDRVYVLTCENIEAARMMHAIYYGPSLGAPFFDFEAYHAAFVKAVHDLVREGVECREWFAENTGEAAWAILGALSVAIEVQLSHPEASLGRDGLSRVLKLIFKGISAGSEEGHG